MKKISDTDYDLYKSYENQTRVLIREILDRLSLICFSIDERHYWRREYVFDVNKNPFTIYSADGEMMSDLKRLRDLDARNRMHRIRLFP